MTSCRVVTFAAVKLPARPLVEEFVSPLLFGLTEATSNATSADVGIVDGDWAEATDPTATAIASAILAISRKV